MVIGLLLSSLVGLDRNNIGLLVGHRITFDFWPKTSSQNGAAKAQVRHQQFLGCIKSRITFFVSQGLLLGLLSKYNGRITCSGLGLLLLSLRITLKQDCLLAFNRDYFARYGAAWPRIQYEWNNMTAERCLGCLLYWFSKSRILLHET